MAVIASQPPSDRRKLRRSARAVAAAAIAAGLALGGGTLSASPAVAADNAGAENGVMSVQAFEGPFPRWDYCNTDRRWAEYLGYDTTPCFRDPDGWYYQYF